MKLEEIKKVIKKLCLDMMGKQAVKTADWDIDVIAEAVHKYCEAYNIEARLALAQGILECHFGLAPGANRSRKTRNIYNVGNVDDGGNRYFPTYASGIEAYCKLLCREYNWGYYDGVKISSYKPSATAQQLNPYPITAERMMGHDFCRPKGGRYATDPEYTIKIATILNKIDKALRAK